jgi:3-deoxy-D-manno-octulosonic-acid transferase
MRHLYSAILYLIAPFVVTRLLWRGLKSPGYWRRWGERFGFYQERFPPGPCIWVHAVSVGEVQASLPLIRSMRRDFPRIPILITTMTPTGSDRVREGLTDVSVEHVYAPYDLPGAVRRFLNAARPRLAVIMETELWPNLFHQCARRDIPVLVANARLSERSARGYRRLLPLARETLGCVTRLAAQSDADARRLISIGADPRNTVVTGSIKFETRLPASLHEQAEVLRRQWGTDRPVWIAASTHEGEDEQVLKAFDAVRAVFPDALLVLVPRHPERFAKVAALATRRGHRVALRSEQAPLGADTSVFVGDTMGELPLFCAASDVAFVGGSLVPTGGHNMLEPAALGLPVVVGPHVFNFAEISRCLLAGNAARQVKDSGELARVIIEFLGDANLRHEVGENGRRFVEANKGALEKLAGMVRQLLEETKT